MQVEPTIRLNHYALQDVLQAMKSGKEFQKTNIVDHGNGKFSIERKKLIRKVVDHYSFHHVPGEDQIEIKSKLTKFNYDRDYRILNDLCHIKYIMTSGNWVSTWKRSTCKFFISSRQHVAYCCGFMSMKKWQPGRVAVRLCFHFYWCCRNCSFLFQRFRWFPEARW